mmetsp:Transcript_12026/g.30412  ORF Transcript_12026/g.30412 Transcript_12026/m.30412 type:complete len:460 (-) Transcript_12026:132-1511(-)
MLPSHLMANLSRQALMSCGSGAVTVSSSWVTGWRSVMAAACSACRPIQGHCSPYSSSPISGWPAWAAWMRIWWVRPVRGWQRSSAAPACSAAAAGAISCPGVQPAAELMSASWLPASTTKSVCAALPPSPTVRATFSRSSCAMGASMVKERPSAAASPGLPTVMQRYVFRTSLSAKAAWTDATISGFFPISSTPLVHMSSRCSTCGGRPRYPMRRFTIVPPTKRWLGVVLTPGGLLTAMMNSSSYSTSTGSWSATRGIACSARLYIMTLRFSGSPMISPTSTARRLMRSPFSSVSLNASARHRSRRRSSSSRSSPSIASTAPRSSAATAASSLPPLAPSTSAPQAAMWGLSRSGQQLFRCLSSVETWMQPCPHAGHLYISTSARRLARCFRICRLLCCGAASDSPAGVSAARFFSPVTEDILTAAVGSLRGSRCAARSSDDSLDGGGDSSSRAAGSRGM